VVPVTCIPISQSASAPPLNQSLGQYHGAATVSEVVPCLLRWTQGQELTTDQGCLLPYPSQSNLRYHAPTVRICHMY